MPILSYSLTLTITQSFTTICSLVHSTLAFYSSRELGQDLPEGDSRQEAVLVMLGRRVEVLKQKLQELEKEQQERLTAGEKTKGEADIACCNHSHFSSRETEG